MDIAEYPTPQTDSDWQILAFETRDLFSAGPIDEEPLFAGRQAQIVSLLDATLDRSRHAILFGERGVGKTSLADIFWKKYATTLKSIVAARVQADPSDGFDTLWTKVLEELQATAIAKGLSEKVRINADIFPTSVDNLRREFTKINADIIPIIIIDEFDKVDDEDAKNLTANLIKSLSDYGVNATILLVGVAEDVGDLLAAHKSITRNLTQIKLERMSAKELREVIELRLKRLPMTITDNASNAIVQISKGLPYYVLALGRHAFFHAASEHRLEVNEKDVDHAMEKVVNESEQSFYDEYRRATESNQSDAKFKQVLLACALARADDSGFFTPNSIVDPLGKILGKTIVHASFQRHLSEFISEHRGCVLMRRGRERNYRFRFTDPMMQPYVLIKGIRDGMYQVE